MRLRARALLISLGTLLGFAGLALAPACDRANPLYRGAGGPSDGGAGTSVAGQTGVAGAGGDAGIGGDAGSGGVAGTTLPPVDGSTDVGVEVPLSGCVDNDGDGFGVGSGCMGPDCDDTNKAVTRTSSRACYDGKAGTMGVGACRGGTQTCTDGAWSACLGQVLPTVGESCNGVDDDCDGTPDDGLGMISCGLGACAQTVAACAQGALGVCRAVEAPTFFDDCNGKDDDCDGAIDEDCQTACVHVIPNGDDPNATGTVLRPFRTIQAAINFAAGAPGRPKNVCVAGGQTCLDTNVYSSGDAGALTMANGVSVYGNYESRNWSRCPFGATGLPNLTVILQSRSGKGVVFPATITERTILDGVHVGRPPAGVGGGNITTTIGVSVEGAKNVLISNVVVDDTDPVASSTGVSLSANAEATITRSAIFAGLGTTEAVGIRSVGSKPTIVDNCGAFDATTGHCVAACGAMTLGVHGRLAQSVGATSVAIDLVDSPAAVVERNAVCGAQAKLGAGVRVSGAAANVVVRGSSIVAQGGTVQAFGVTFGACADGAPRVADNELVQADTAATSTGARVVAVAAAGACHPVVDGNAKITGGGEGTPGTSTGVFCGADGGVASRCLVTNNRLVQGSPSVHPTTSTGVACEAGGCARVSGNRLAGTNGGTAIGLSLAGSSAFVDRNEITGGCGSKTIGVLAEDASARLENNLVRGAICGPNQATLDVAGLRVHVAAGGNELDVHSNTIDAGGMGSCSGTAASLGLGGAAAPSGARGVFRNNVLRAGNCAIARYDFLEESAKIGPRLFENDDLDPTGTPTALYLTGAGKPLATAAAVNMLAGASGNVSGDPRFVGPADYHLSSGGSACVDMGTTKGAPKADFDGKARDDKPDIGAFER
jgi:hypothetical protein